MTFGVDGGGVSRYHEGILDFLCTAVVAHCNCANWPKYRVSSAVGISYINLIYRCYYYYLTQLSVNCEKEQHSQESWSILPDKDQINRL